MPDPNPILSKNHAHFRENLREFVFVQLPRGVKDDALLNRKETLRANDTRLSELPAFEISSVQRDREIVRSRTRCNLTKNQIVTRKIDNY